MSIYSANCCWSELSNCLIGKWHNSLCVVLFSIQIITVLVHLITENIVIFLLQTAYSCNEIANE